jgi:hypothetical protein
MFRARKKYNITIVWDLTLADWYVVAILSVNVFPFDCLIIKMKATLL